MRPERRSGRFGRLVADPGLRRQAIRYLVTGVASAAVEYGLFALFEGGFGWSIPLANSLAMACAFAVNFTLSRFWTFSGAGGAVETARSLALYLVLLGFNMVATAWLIGLFVSWGVAALVAKPITMALVVAWNFILYRTVVFRNR